MRATYRISEPQVVHDSVDGEILAIDFTSGSYYSLRGSAAAIWDAVAEASDLEEIVARVAEQYHDDDLAGGVQRLLDLLVGEGLLDREGRVDGPIPVTGAGGEPLGVPGVEKYTDMEEIILLDPVHDVSEAGWPAAAT